MENVFFDYKIDFSTIIEERKINFESLDIYDLKSICNGKIYVFFHSHKNKRNFIILETGIIDYLLQFDDLILSIERGIDKTFTVSCDYYNNNLRYEYSDISHALIINEGNTDTFTIQCNYDDFKKEYLKFRKKIVQDLNILYPELGKNKAFIEYFKLNR